MFRFPMNRNAGSYVLTLGLLIASPSLADLVDGVDDDPRSLRAYDNQTECEPLHTMMKPFVAYHDITRTREAKNQIIAVLSDESYSIVIPFAEPYFSAAWGHSLADLLDGPETEIDAVIDALEACREAAYNNNVRTVATLFSGMLSTASSTRNGVEANLSPFAAAPDWGIVGIGARLNLWKTVLRDPDGRHAEIIARFAAADIGAIPVEELRALDLDAILLRDVLPGEATEALRAAHDPALPRIKSWYIETADIASVGARERVAWSQEAFIAAGREASNPMKQARAALEIALDQEDQARAETLRHEISVYDRLLHVGISSTVGGKLLDHVQSVREAVDKRRTAEQFNTEPAYAAIVDMLHRTRDMEIDPEEGLFFEPADGGFVSRDLRLRIVSGFRVQSIEFNRCSSLVGNEVVCRLSIAIDELVNKPNLEKEGPDYVTEAVAEHDFDTTLVFDHADDGSWSAAPYGDMEIAEVFSFLQ